MPRRPSWLMSGFYCETFGLPLLSSPGVVAVADALPYDAGAIGRVRRWNWIAFAFCTGSSDGRARFGLCARRGCVGRVRDPDSQGKVGSRSD